MRISEKMGLVYTALFLTVSVAVITQNSDRLMELFRGGSPAQAVDDVFTVQTDRSETLPVLQNDIAAQTLPPGKIRLTESPACGAVHATGSGFIYRGAATCSGYQSFSYCLDTGRGCKPATVALRLIAPRDPVDSIRTGPITDLAGLDTQVGINGQDLEITNVHLGQTAPTEIAASPVLASKLARTAVETLPNFSRPAPLSRAIKVNAVFDIPALPATDTSGLSREASSNDQVLSDTTPAPLADVIKLPEAPDDGMRSPLPRADNAPLAARARKTDTAIRLPTVMPGIDNSPFGTPCGADLTASVKPGALVQLALRAPCYPNSTVEIRHAKLRIRLKTDHIGHLTTLVPAFEENARFQIRIARSKTMMAAVRVPALNGMDRIAIQWRGVFSVSLNPDGPLKPVPLRADDIASALHHRGGFTMMLGDMALPTPIRAAVFTRQHSNQMPQRVLGFAVRVGASDATCGQAEVIQSFRSRGGRMVAASGLQFKMPTCGSKTQSILLKNAVRDLMIAQN